MNRLILVLIGTLIFITPTAHAHKAGHVYIAVNVGPTFLPDKSFAATGDTNGTINSDHEVGFNVATLLGYYITRHWATEFSFGLVSNELKSARRDNTALNDTDNFASVSFFVNGIYHFDPFTGTFLRPYVGAGIGILQEVDTDLEKDKEYQKKNAFGYQFIAGLAYSIHPHWDITTDIRYRRSENLTLKDSKNPSNQLRNIDYDPILWTFGVNYHF